MFHCISIYNTHESLRIHMLSLIYIYFRTHEVCGHLANFSVEKKEDFTPFGFGYLSPILW